MKYILSAIILLISAGASLAMVGGPLFCVGHQATAMTVEVTQLNIEMSSPGVGGTHEVAASNRMMLTARYGIASFVDIAGSVGAADLRFAELSGGFSEYAADWSVAWGASARAGYPVDPRKFQIVGLVSYLGFQPKGTTGNAMKTIESKYLWHELVPSVTAGYRFGPVVPYLGISKPYLFGDRKATVALNGTTFPSAGSEEAYADAEQPLRGIVEVE